MVGNKKQKFEKKLGKRPPLDDQKQLKLNRIGSPTPQSLKTSLIQTTQLFVLFPNTKAGLNTGIEEVLNSLQKTASKQPNITTTKQKIRKPNQSFKCSLGSCSIR